MTPIQPAEYASRVAQAQQSMREQGIDAIYLEAGSNLLYFTGVPWRRSERTCCEGPKRHAVARARRVRAGVEERCCRVHSAA